MSKRLPDVDSATPPAVDGATPTVNGSPMADLILVTAAALFRQKGYVRTTTRELGHGVGIRGPSVYYHYSTKEEILYGICVESLRRLTERVAVATAVEGSIERLRAVIETHVVNILDDRDMHATMLTEMRFLSPDRRQQVTEKRDDYEGLISEAIADAQRDGTVRADVPARQMSLALLSLLNWTIFWFRPDGALTVSEVAKLLATLFLEGAMLRGADT